MRTHKSVLRKGLAILGAVWMACFFAGCRSGETRQALAEPVLFPAPPEAPRLQFLTAFAGPQDLGAKPVGGFERFVLGEPETVEGITTPYGMAIFAGKLYVCDVGKSMVGVFDLRNRTFGYLTKDRRLVKPVNICIDEDGTKYVADPTAGVVFVFDRDDNLSTMLGKEVKISPMDVAVRGPLCYVTDYASNQVVVLNKTTGQEITRIGQKRSAAAAQAENPAEVAPGEFSLISDLALDQQGNIYVTDRAAARITQFDASGLFRRTIGRLGDNIDEFVRPKGIAIDRENRIWVVDAATEVVKIYNDQAQLLLFFGEPGIVPGAMNLPATVLLDYDNVELFRKYAIQGASIEFLVFVSNQYGPNKISVYGFGTFPVQGRAVAQAGQARPQAPARTKPDASGETKLDRARKIAELYNSSMALYRGGQLAQARQGFVQILASGLIPGDMATTIKGYIADIDAILARDSRAQEIADLYYQSMSFYRGGQLEKAREGLLRVLNSGSIPPAMAKAIEGYLADIERKLASGQGRRP